MITGERTAILGGCSRVGLPPPVTFAARDCGAAIVDIDASAVEWTSRAEADDASSHPAVVPTGAL